MPIELRNSIIDSEDNQLDFFSKKLTHLLTFEDLRQEVNLGAIMSNERFSMENDMENCLGH